PQNNTRRPGASTSGTVAPSAAASSAGEGRYAAERAIRTVCRNPAAVRAAPSGGTGVLAAPPPGAADAPRASIGAVRAATGSAESEAPAVHLLRRRLRSGRGRECGIGAQAFLRGGGPDRVHHEQ